MNGVHDMGGMQCFGPITPAPEKPLFQATWERQVLAMVLAMGATGTWTLDESRFTRESLPPEYYLSAGYYRIWLLALERLLVKYALVSEQELAAGTSQSQGINLKRRLTVLDVPIALATGSPVSRPATSIARFRVGQMIVVGNRHTPMHTRLPAYIRGRRGVIRTIHGCHVFPDSNAAGKGEDPQWLYNVCFTATELWGAPSPQLDAVHVDCWEPYLESV